MPDKRRTFVENAIEEGSEARIILFDELLSMLNITEDELNSLPLPEDASGTPANAHHGKKGSHSCKAEQSPVMDEVIVSDEVTVIAETDESEAVANQNELQTV
jgi:hypothetical protein